MIEIQQLLKIPELKKTSERAELVKFFVDNVTNKKGKKYSAGFIASKLAHIPTKDLYYMISVAKDYERRGGSIGKYFWGSLKTSK